ncbi:hypothetical protein SDC9_173176 [bioreactor metagenome]|uniref:Uncharacterized protein n=1 Tax=bioreactor metagenome TaxID=1076179 RepID=A0A645GFQ3_9ZZZZ
MRAGRRAGQHGRIVGLHRDDFDAGIFCLQRLAHAGDGAARSDPRDKGGNPAVCVAPDLFGGRLSVYFGVCGIIELLRNKGILNLRGQLLRLADGPLHALLARGKHQLGV